MTDTLFTSAARRANGLRARAVLALCLVGCVAACHPGPVVDTGGKPPSTGGTIAGIVSAAGGATSLSGRKVTATNEATGAKFEATTATNGGYTIQVPAGRYRLDVELRAGESLSTRPDPTTVDVGDLDTERNFSITASR
jgi:hypothetical protein